MENSASASFLGGNKGKAGVPSEGLDRKRIDSIIEEASKGSKFYQFQQRHEERIVEKCAALRKQMDLFSRDPLALERAQDQVESKLAELERARDLQSSFIHVDMDGTGTRFNLLRVRRGSILRCRRDIEAA